MPAPVLLDTASGGVFGSTTHTTTSWPTSGKPANGRQIIVFITYYSLNQPTFSPTSSPPGWDLLGTTSASNPLGTQATSSLQLYAFTRRMTFDTTPPVFDHTNGSRTAWAMAVIKNYDDLDNDRGDATNSSGANPIVTVTGLTVGTLPAIGLFVPVVHPTTSTVSTGGWTATGSETPSWTKLQEVNQDFRGLALYTKTLAGGANVGSSSAQYATTASDQRRGFVITVKGTSLANSAPTSNAGPDQGTGLTVINPGQTVTLDGRYSTDFDDGVDWSLGGSTGRSGGLDYGWSQIGGPNLSAGQSAIVPTPGPDGYQTATFTAPNAGGDYIFQLKVGDYGGGTAGSPLTPRSTDTDSVLIRIAGPPTVNAGVDRNVVVSPAGPSTVTLTATASAFGSATISTYAWTQISGTSVGTITNANTAVASYANPTTEGARTFKVVVTDSNGNTAQDTVTITNVSSVLVYRFVQGRFVFTTNPDARTLEHRVVSDTVPNAEQHYYDSAFLGPGAVSRWSPGGLSSGDVDALSVSFETSTDGGQTWRPVRNGTGVVVINGGAQVSDYEAPPNVVTQYRARGVSFNRFSDWSLPIEVVAEPIYTWLKVVHHPGLNTGVILVDDPEVTSQRKATIFEALGRRSPIVVGLGRGPNRGRITVAALDLDERQRIVGLLESGHTLLVQIPAESGSEVGEQRYLEVVEDLTTARAFGLDIDRAVERLVSFSWVEVDQPPPDIA